MAAAEEYVRDLATWRQHRHSLPVLMAEYDRRGTALAERDETIERLCVDLDRLEHAAREWRYAEDEIRVRRQEYATLEAELVSARSENDRLRALVADALGAQGQADEQRNAVLAELDSSATAGLQHVSIDAVRRALGVTE